MLGDFVKKITRHLQDTFMLFEGVFDHLVRIVYELYSDSFRIGQVKYTNKFNGLLPKSLILLWSGRRDSNSRPSAPKADGVVCK